MATLSELEARQRLDRLPGWALDGASIRRQYTFAGFADALSFVLRLGLDAEAADHHPDIRISYRRVTLVYSTHSEGGLTEKDFAGAAGADTLAVRLGGA
ncbi:MAG TPA: 4a-hydroxytetrahydrobiopterin dehydratase [Vicinamibacterales bacterium]|nr:4a-hydroxytetrahydrobiopterin dehydratase [Vicinamibacterales bacterium]